MPLISILSHPISSDPILSPTLSYRDRLPSSSTWIDVDNAPICRGPWSVVCRDAEGTANGHTVPACVHSAGHGMGDCDRRYRAWRCVIAAQKHMHAGAWKAPLFLLLNWQSCQR